MLTAEAHIATERPGRYLVQLCKHFDNKGRHLGHRPRSHSGDDTARSARTHTLPEISPDQIHVEWTDTDGTIRLPWGQCILRATPGTLTVRAEAADQDNLARIQQLVTTHMARFSRREPLGVEWQPSETRVTESGDTERPAPPRQRRGRTRVVVVGAVIVAVALHLALGGSVLADTAWTGWAVGFVVTAVLVKVAVVGGLAVRRGTRRTG